MSNRPVMRRIRACLWRRRAGGLFPRMAGYNTAHEAGCSLIVQEGSIVGGRPGVRLTKKRLTI